MQNLHTVHYIAVGVIRALMSPKKILNVDLSCLPKCADFFTIDFRKQETVSNFRVNRFLYRGGLTGKY